MFSTGLIVTKPIKGKITREHLLTEEDLEKLLRACNGNLRDRALIHVQYEAGTRAGELLSLKLKHVKFDQYGAFIYVDGKTGARPVRLVVSVPSLAAWCNSHPFREDPESPLWIKTDKHGEAFVKVNSDKAIANTKGVVVADYAWKDTTRFKTFLQIARDTGRKFCISFREAYYIRELKKFIPDLPDLNDPSILLYKRKQKTGTYRESDYDKEEREFLDMENTVDANYVHKNQNDVIIELSYFGVPELIDIRPNPGSLFIKSASEAFNEEQVFDLDRLKRWLGHFKMNYENFHASGHAPQEDLKKVMEGSDAKKIVPIHTEHPEMFSPLIKHSIKIEPPKPSY